MPAASAEPARAKVNLTLRIVGRRADGYHEIESLVAFAGACDRLTFTRGPQLTLLVRGPTAQRAGAVDDNLVLTAARALAERVSGLKLGHFTLFKYLPVAAGLGGGSADAAAALRLLARANGLASDDPRLLQAAQATGADVPVCLDSRSRVMCGIGEILSEPLDLRALPAVLVNPGVAVATREVFAALRRADFEAQRMSEAQPRHSSFERLSSIGDLEKAELFSLLATEPNDLERPAIELQPLIATVLAALARLPGCRLARMSGSGATCFGLFDAGRAAGVAAGRLRVVHPEWWVRTTALG